MTPQVISEKEALFAKTLKDSNGTIWTKIDDINLTETISITKIRPKFSTYYYQKETEKSKICLHFTVGVLPGDIATLGKDNTKVSVNYVVARDGAIYQLFDDKYWSYHLGSNCIGANEYMSKATIGIEISNYGPLKLSGNNLLDAYGNIYCKKTDTEHYIQTDYRGYKYYATMTESQEKSIIELLKYLCKTNNIPMVFKTSIGDVFGCAMDARNFSGIFAHTNVRKDKFDWPPALIENIINRCTEPDPAIDEVPADKTAVSIENEDIKTENTILTVADVIDAIEEQDRETEKNKTDIMVLKPTTTNEDIQKISPFQYIINFFMAFLKCFS